MKDSKRFVVVTSINSPNQAMIRSAKGCLADGDRFIVVGDTKSPADFQLDGCSYYG